MGGLISTIVGDINAAALKKRAGSGIYRPAQWTGPAMVSITVPAQTSSTTDSSGNLTTTNTAQTTYVFDAVLGLEHEQRLTRTRHPVQTGADISSHAFLEPAQLVLYVGMSDAMDSYANGFDATKPPYITPFTGNASKSVSAYQQMLTLQASRIPLTVTTRLRTYTNMLIDSVAPREDNKTINGLRMRVEFGQIRTAAVVSQPVSARPNDTESTGLGAVNVQPPSTAVTQQFNASSYANALSSPPTVLGSGAWSSVNINSLQNLPAPFGSG